MMLDIHLGICGIPRSIQDLVAMSLISQENGFKSMLISLFISSSRVRISLLLIQWVLIVGQMQIAPRPTR
jgi:hypothetical protein